MTGKGWNVGAKALGGSLIRIRGRKERQQRRRAADEGAALPLAHCDVHLALNCSSLQGEAPVAEPDSPLSETVETGLADRMPSCPDPWQRQTFRTYVELGLEKEACPQTCASDEQADNGICSPRAHCLASQYAKKQHKARKTSASHAMSVFCCQRANAMPAIASFSSMSAVRFKSAFFLFPSPPR